MHCTTVASQAGYAARCIHTYTKLPYYAHAHAHTAKGIHWQQAWCCSRPEASGCITTVSLAADPHLTHRHSPPKHPVPHIAHPGRLHSHWVRFAHHPSRTSSHATTVIACSLQHVLEHTCRARSHSHGARPGSQAQPCHGTCMRQSAAGSAHDRAGQEVVRRVRPKHAATCQRTRNQ